MNFYQSPYEADFGLPVDQNGNKMMPMSIIPPNASGMQSMGMPVNMQPMANGMGQMQLPAATNVPVTYAQMPGSPMPFGQLPVMQPMPAMTPLNGMAQMPMMMSTPMGGIDAGGLNAVVPDLQSMSAMGQGAQPMHQGRMAGGYSSAPSSNGHSGSSAGGGAGNASSGQQHGYQSSAANWNGNGYGNSAATKQYQEMPSNNSFGNGGYSMWAYNQPQATYSSITSPQQYQQHQQHNPYQQQQQHQPQQQRMSDMSSSKEARNGLNTPIYTDQLKFSRAESNQFRNSSAGKGGPIWR